MSIFSVNPLGGEADQRSWWLYLILGILLLLGGVIVLGDVVLASVISAIFIAWVIIISGIIQVVHAFSVRDWKYFILDLLLGVLYVVAGLILLSNPVAASVTLTLALGVILILSGIFRLVLAGAVRQDAWGILFSGIVALLVGIVILARWPASGLWVLGLLLGIDLIFNGLAWISYSFSVRSKSVIGRA
jgi:uncharacterized membrane protein HdeD (DUF308 family)